MSSRREFKNFVNRTQTESDKEIQRYKKIKKMHFFACILDSLMLQGAHYICVEGYFPLAVKI